MQDEVRRLCMDYMEQERDYFSEFVTEDFPQYIARKRQNATYGNHLELQAVSELFNRPIEIFAHQPEPLNLFQTAYDDQNPPIRLSYHNGNHYNSVRDPNNPTVGVGLGFPVYEPGIADKLQLESAMRESESAMVESELVAASILQSDQDAASEAILQAETAAFELEYAQKQIDQAVVRESLNAALSDALRNLLPPH
jgi:OTU domain-containing protein 5